MSEPLFDIVFRGDLMPGHSLPEVKGRLAQLFKIDAAKVEPLFSGAAVTLKRNLDKPTATKYHTVLRSAGAAVDVRPVMPEQTAAAAPQRAAAGFTLAPLGAELLSPQERPRVPEPALDLGRYSVRPLEGYLLDEAERNTDEVALQLDYEFALAPVGADLVEGRSDPEPAPEINPQFDLAEPGANLLKPEETSKREVVQIQTDHISLV